MNEKEYLNVLFKIDFVCALEENNDDLINATLRLINNSEQDAMPFICEQILLLEDLDTDYAVEILEGINQSNPINVEFYTNLIKGDSIKPGFDKSIETLELAYAAIDDTISVKSRQEVLTKILTRLLLLRPLKIDKIKFYKEELRKLL